MIIGRLRAERLVLRAVGGLLLAFFLLPIFALLCATPLETLKTGLGHPLVWPALRLSLSTTSYSLLLSIVLGTPLAWSIATPRGRGARWVETAVQLPMVIPPAVAGIALLLAFGRKGVLAGWLYPAEWAVTFTTPAVIIAELFVSAPFFVQAAISAFRRIDPSLILVARACGASPMRVFLRIAIPLAAPGLAAGAAMGWARALGEFGATLMFAGNLEGETQTLPLAIYTVLESDLRAAQALSVLLVIVACLLLLLARAALQHANDGAAP